MPDLMRRSGGEFRVNTSEGRQFVANAAALPDGGFITTWMFQTQGLLAQRFDADGVKVGGEIVVNDVAFHSGWVAALESGGFVVSWSVGDVIAARVFDAAGAPLGAAFQVNTETASFNIQHSYVFALPSGGFVVTWIHQGPPDAADFSISAQLFDAAGARIGGEIPVNGVGPGEPTVPVGVAIDGGFVIVWHDPHAGGGPTDYNVSGQLFDTAGNPVGGPFLVNTATAGFQGEPDITALPNGGFAVAYQSTDGGNQVRAQMFDAAGNKVGPEMVAGTPGHGIAYVAVTATAWGGLLVVWEDTAPPGFFSPSLHAQLFDYEGNRLGSEFKLNTDGLDSNSRPDLVTLASGEILAIWDNQTSQQAQDPGIKAQLLLAPDIGTLGADLIDGTAGDDAIAGLAGDDRIDGGAGADLLDGGPGNDVLIGGADLAEDGMWGETGDDVYYAGAGDAVYERAGEGNDRVAASGSFTLAAGSEVERIEAITLSATDAMDLGGNELANVIVGNNGVNFLRGEAGNDQLIALGGDDYLIGGAGIDVMYGGLGNDTYYVDDAGDVVVEAAGEGADRVAAATSYALAAGAEVERLEALNLTGTITLELTGNEFANTILGNNGLNFLRGDAGNDVLHGFGGTDFLIGGTGADLMSGGLGNDTFYVDDAGDVAFEAAGQGIDRIAASVSYALSNGSEIELLEAVNLTATDAFDLTGSDSANTISGNYGANILRGEGGNDVLRGHAGDDFLVGGAGADTMVGGAGNDTHYVDNAGDVVSELAGEGIDRVAASASFALSNNSEVESLEAVTRAATDAMDLAGSDTANAILGNDGVNALDGKGGNDVLWGFGGADTFAFTTALAAGNVDRIADFVSGTDRIALDDAVFAGLAPGALAAGAFVTGTQAGDADDRIVYNSATGELFFDADGNGAGAAILFAVLDGHPPLAASDFTVI
jgi:Ca2+-binding RTX toxin-like protein